ncbi:uncharacterized protein LOC119319105 [Triticum dicoccoides]|uniref:uncharacterized protein LOC119319105 n=1 Tax=Triticum dicoccoides TaxID=85692 RepID=UPI00188E06B2|nr:uncharacterized protein LOC119319105 [Triticum dicoccoides]
MMRLPPTGCPECGREELSLKQSATSLNPGKYSVEWQGYEVECLRNGKDLKVKEWCFFMWLDKYLDMVEEIWMINVLIVGTAAAHRVSQGLKLMLQELKLMLFGLRLQHWIDVSRSWLPKMHSFRF